MSTFRTFSTIIILSCAIVVLTAAMPVKQNFRAVNESTTGFNELVSVNKINGKQLNRPASSWQGRKLTIKERIGVKLFGKKIIHKMASAQGVRPGEKSQLVALLLGFLPLFIWICGLHRFYLGYTWQGLAQLITFGGCGVWWLIDMVRIISGDLKPRVDEYERDRRTGKP